MKPQSLQSQYALERERVETVETDKYFFTFKMVEREFHVIDIFIKPEFRSSEVSNELQKKIHEKAQEYAADFIVGFIVKGMNGNERSLVYQLKHGMRIHNWDEHRIILIKKV